MEGTQAELEILAEEIKLPEYEGLSPQEIAERLNSIPKLTLVKTITGLEFGVEIDFNDFKGLSIEQQNTLGFMWLMPLISIEAGFFLTFIQNTFPDGTVTRANLTSKFVHATTRAVELGLGKVGDHHVKMAQEFNIKLEAANGK